MDLARSCEQPHYGAPTDFGQHVRLGLQPVVAGLVQGNLEYAPFDPDRAAEIFHFALHEQGPGRGAGAEDLLDAPLRVDALPRHRDERVHANGCQRFRGRCVLDSVELVQEPVHRVEPFGDVCPGCLIHKAVELFRHGVRHSRGAQPTVVR